MRKSLPRAVVATALTVPLAFGIGAGTAAAAPQVTNLQVPIVTGFQIAPGAVPGGFFQTIPMKATVGDEPGVATFSAANIAPFADQYPYRYLNLSWRNLATGATGAADLRHWQDDPTPPADNFFSKQYLPLEVVPNTGPGPVVVTVTHSRDYSYGAEWGSPYLDTLLPGAGVVFVP